MIPLPPLHLVLTQVGAGLPGYFPLSPRLATRLRQPGLVGAEKQTVFKPKAVWRRAVFWVAGDYHVVLDRANAPRSREIVTYLRAGDQSLLP